MANDNDNNNDDDNHLGSKLDAIADFNEQSPEEHLEYSLMVNRWSAKECQIAWDRLKKKRFN